MAERRLVFDDTPSAPVSGDNLDRNRIPAGEPSPPISGDNIDYSQHKTLKFDDDSPAQKSVSRIREIAGKMRSGEPYAPGPADYIVDAASLSTARPISAAVGAATGGLLNSYPGSNYDERYKAAIQYLNDRAARAEQATGPVAPIVGGIAQIPASMATGGGSAALRAGTPAATRTVGGAATNPVTAAARGSIPASSTEVAARAAVPGAIEGASQHAESLDSAATGAATNAALSATVAGGLDKGMKAALPAAGRAAKAEATAARGASPDEIKAEAKTLYTQLDNSGIAYSPQQTAGLYTALHDMRNRGQFSEAANPGLRDHFNNLMALTRQGASFNQLHDLRSVIAEQARGPDPSTRRAAGQILNEIDRVVTGAAPAINPNNVNIQQIYPEASRLWRGASLADDAGWIADKTERKMAAKSGVDPDATTRANFAAVEQRVSKPGAYDPYTDRQRDLLSRVIRGDPIQNAQAATGDFLKNNANKIGIGAGAATSAAGLAKGFEAAPSVLAAAVGLPMTGAANMAGKAFKTSAASRGQGNVNALLRDITGSAPPVPGGAISRDDLAKILFAQDLERLAPRVGSQVMGNQQEQRP